LTKKYNDKLRWSKDGHTSSREIFEKETQILSRIQHLDCVPKIFAFDNNDMTISMQYSGESLYYNFALPSDWESQVQKTFKDFSDSGVYYPEFRLHNILVLDGVISFVDFGLSELDSGKDNIDNCNRFIRYLSLLDDRFKSVVSVDEKHMLYDTFLTNIGEV
jgi:tRNA A-37 threonylcarbamoyl transferase component Bud32